MAHILPKVSILLPNYNYRRFLDARLQSILTQTVADWELIIVDSYSNDGAWELIQEYASQDARIRAFQAPREGIYAGLNRCLGFAQGQYIYIAMSDDTMSPHCLETMVKAMEAHPECDVCQSQLELIDEAGILMADRSRVGHSEHFFGELLKRAHIRHAPYDGLLHCVVGSVYPSLTQLLIRRTVFDKVGLFPLQWGSQGDFEWGMRVGLVCNILYIPETLATLRIHPHQASAISDYESAAQQIRFCAMMESAFPILAKQHPDEYRKIQQSRMFFPYRRKQIEFGLKDRPRRIQKAWFLASVGLHHPMAVREYLTRRFLGKIRFPDDFTYIRQELNRLGFEQQIKML